MAPEVSLRDVCGTFTACEVRTGSGDAAATVTSRVARTATDVVESAGTEACLSEGGRTKARTFSPIDTASRP